MEPTIESVLVNVNNASVSIDHLLNQLRDFTDCYNTKDATTEEKTTINGLFNNLIDKLEDANALVGYYQTPIKAEGNLAILTINGTGCYVLGEHQLVCGSIIEFLHEDLGWIKTTIDYSNGIGAYYAVGYSNVNLLKVKVRIRC